MPFKRVFYGWWVVAALFVIGMLGPTSRYVATAFGPFLLNEPGWNAATVGLTLAIILWSYALTSVGAGQMVDRLGSRRTIMVGGFILFAAILLFSLSRELWLSYVAFALIGAGVSMAHYLATQSTSRKWFSRKAGTVGGILAAPFALGIGIFVPVLTASADSYGWRAAGIVFAIGAGAVIILLAALVIRDTPESMGLHPDGRAPQKDARGPGIPMATVWSVRQTLGTFSFWMVLPAYGLLGFVTQGLMGHVVLWGVDLGASKASAGIYLSAYLIPSAAFNFLGGWLGDRFGKRKIITIAYALSGVIMIFGWLTVNSLQTLVVFAILQGCAFGLTTGPGLWVAYVGDVYGRATVGRLFGIMTLAYGATGGLGPVAWGNMRETFGSYNLACLLTGLVYVVMIVTTALARPPARSGERKVQGASPAPTASLQERP